ncbi:MAG: hypothetical protein K0R73_434 [Candidatus Midichloriaceae bacterium]|nr:hypothetical protein [Candidatus Midichloriaceae bacterium]
MSEAVLEPMVFDEKTKVEVNIYDCIKKRKITWLVDRRFFDSNESDSIVSHAKMEYFNDLNMETYEKINIMFQKEKQAESENDHRILINQLSLQFGDEVAKQYVEAKAKIKILSFSSTHLKAIKALINGSQLDENNITAEYHNKILELGERELYKRAWYEYSNIYSLASGGHLLYLHVIIGVTKITLEIIDHIAEFVYTTSKQDLLRDRELVLKNLRTIKKTLVDNKINCSGGFIQIFHTEDHVSDLRKAFYEFKKEFVLTPDADELRKFIMNKKAQDDLAYEYIISISTKTGFVVRDKGYDKTKQLSYKTYLNLVSKIANA